MESAEALGQQLEREEKGPLFIISTLDYDNYLARVKAPPPDGKGKENKPRRRTGKRERTGEGDQDSQPNLNEVKENDSTNSSRRKVAKDEEQVITSRLVQDQSDKIPPPKSPSVPVGVSVKPLADISPEVLEQEARSQSETDRHHSATATHQEQSRSPKTVDAGLTEVQASPRLGNPAQASEGSPPGSAVGFEGSVQVHTTKSACSGSAGVASPTANSAGRKKKSNRKESEPVPKNNDTESQTELALKDADKFNRSGTMLGNMEEDKNADVTMANVDDGDKTATSEPTGTSMPKRKELPPRPKDMNERGHRGDIDVLLLHPHCGVILIEVKATGMPYGGYEYREQDIQDTVTKAVEQVVRGRDTFHFIMPDLSCSPSVTMVVALPFLAREQLSNVQLDTLPDDEVVFLCKDDMTSPPQAAGSSHGDGRGATQQAWAPPSGMSGWWTSRIASREPTPLCLKDMRTVVGRVCGLLSIVSVWSRSKPRIEVRTTSQAISETADRVSDIVLLPTQASLLAQPSPSRLCLTGPMGAGKTLLLQLKGRQWLEEGRRVVVLNVRTSGRGRPVGFVLEEAIRRGNAGEGGSVERYDLATSEFHMDVLVADLERGGRVDRLSFVLDELTHHTFPLLEQLAAQYPRCPIWCVAMFVRHLPHGFSHCRLGAVLRSPPSVQLLLKELDLNPMHRDVYSTRSAARGLPCDGPPIVFIQHAHHHARRPHDCEACADELVEVLTETLGMVLPGSDQKQGPDHFKKRSKGRRAAPGTKAVEAKSLSFKDVLFLVGVPLGYYRQQEDGLWMSSPEEVYQFCNCLLSGAFVTRLGSLGVPLKAIIDNTSRDIAIPPTDEIVVTDVMGVQSLERKVVFFLPGGDMLEPSPVSKVGSTGSRVLGGSRANAVPATTQSPPTPRPVESSDSTVPTAQVKSTDSVASVGPSGSVTPGEPSQQAARQHVETEHAAPAATAVLCEPAAENAALLTTVNARTTTDRGQHRTSHTLGQTDTDCTVRTISQHMNLSQEHMNLLQEAPSQHMDLSRETPSPHMDLAQETPSSSSKNVSLANVQRTVDSPSFPEVTDLKRVFGNMMVGDPRLSKRTSAQQPSSEDTDQDMDAETGPSQKISRMGMDMRGDSPWLLSALEEDAAQRRRWNEEGASTSECEERSYFSADSVFEVADLGEEASQRGTELQRIQQAISTLSMDDQDWLLMAAARCLSQLVVILP